MFRRISQIVIFSLFCLTMQVKFVNAIGINPTNFILKPYIGMSFNFWSQAGKYKNNIGSGFDILSNLDVHAGLRIHNYFGLEMGYSRFSDNKIKAGQDIGNVGFNSDNFYTDLILYYPIYEIFGNAIEVYGSAGLIYMNQKFSNSVINQSNSVWTGKFGAGLQARIFGASSAKLGVDYYHTDYSYLSFKLPYIVTLKFGFDVYFL